MAPFQVHGVQLSQGCRSAETLQGGETVNFLPHTYVPKNSWNSFDSPHKDERLNELTFGGLIISQKDET